MDLLRDNEDDTVCILCFLQQERIDIEEKYANLQEEAAGKTKKLKKVWSMLMSAKSEVCTLNHNHSRIHHPFGTPSIIFIINFKVPLTPKIFFR